MQASEHLTDAEEDLDDASDMSAQGPGWDSPRFHGRLMLALVRATIARVRLRGKEIAEKARYVDAYEDRTALLREQFNYQVERDKLNDEATYEGKGKR